MALNSTDCKIIYAGTGVSRVLPFGFLCLSVHDLLVLKRTDGDEAALVYGSDYTAQLNDDQSQTPGGSVTMAVAPAVGTTVCILRNVAATQPLDLINGGTFRADNIEAALDRATMLLQQVFERLSRSLSLSATDPSSSALPELPLAARINKLIGFDSSGKWAVVSPVTAGALVMTSYMQGLLQSAVNSAAQFRAAIGALQDTPGVITNGHLGSGIVSLGKIAAGALAANDAGRAIMADGFFSASQGARNKFAAGFFAADAYCRALFANGFLPLAKLANGTPNTVIGFDGDGVIAERDPPLNTARYVSAGITINTAGTLQTDIDHGLGIKPTAVRAFMRAIADNNGWAIGDEIELPRQSAWLMVGVTASKIHIKQGTVAPYFFAKTGGTAAIAFSATIAASWRLHVMVDA